jgi:hypothetical protein
MKATIEIVGLLLTLLFAFYIGKAIFFLGLNDDLIGCTFAFVLGILWARESKHIVDWAVKKLV